MTYFIIWLLLYKPLVALANYLNRLAGTLPGDCEEYDILFAVVAVILLFHGLTS